MNRCVTVTGGPIGDEWIGERYADAETTGYEYCSMQELADSYGMLMQKTGDVSWAERMETLFFNAAAGARHPEYPAIAYLKTDNSYSMIGNRRYKYSPVHQDVAVCCVPNSLRIAPYFLKYAWMEADDGTPVAQLLIPCRLDTEIGGKRIGIKVETGYPDMFSFRFLFSGDSVFKFRIRRPVWAENVTCSSEYSEKGGYIELEAVPGEFADLAFGTSERIVRGSDGRNYFAMGPLFYALPLEGEEIPGRVYGEGYRDYEYKGVPAAEYGFAENHEARFSEGVMEVNLMDKEKGEQVRKTLLPLKNTILRQCGFGK